MSALVQAFRGLAPLPARLGLDTGGGHAEPEQGIGFLVDAEVPDPADRRVRLLRKVRELQAPGHTQLLLPTGHTRPCCWAHGGGGAL